jgi:cytochrome c oxidase assembly factor CtaG
VATAAWAHGPAAAGEPSWTLRPEVILPLLALAAVYTIGGARLRRRAGRPLGQHRWVSALVALAAVIAALLSPLDGLADTRLSAHMLQHMLLIAVAAPALLLADPFPVVLWAWPRPARAAARAVLGRRSAAGLTWRWATAMVPAWIGSACVLWAWHLPAAYDAALGHRGLHDLEHLTFVAAALTFWWPVIHPAPRRRRAASYPARVVYLVLGAFQTSALGLLLTLTPVVLYRSYAAGPGALEDQAWGGVVMWSLGGLIDMIAVMILIHRALGPSAPAIQGRRMIGS